MFQSRMTGIPISSAQHWVSEGRLSIGGSERDSFDSSNSLLHFSGKVRCWVETDWLFKCAQKKVPLSWSLARR